MKSGIVFLYIFIILLQVSTRFYYFSNVRTWLVLCELSILSLLDFPFFSPRFKSVIRSSVCKRMFSLSPLFPLLPAHPFILVIIFLFSFFLLFSSSIQCTFLLHYPSIEEQQSCNNFRFICFSLPSQKLSH